MVFDRQRNPRLLVASNDARRKLRGSLAWISRSYADMDAKLAEHVACQVGFKVARDFLTGRTGRLLKVRVGTKRERDYVLIRQLRFVGTNAAVDAAPDVAHHVTPSVLIGHAFSHGRTCSSNRLWTQVWTQRADMGCDRVVSIRAMTDPKAAGTLTLW